MNKACSNVEKFDIARDSYIDTIRGICVVSIIFIHTVFWSGSSYVPNYIRNFALLLDVPLFFFLAGATMSVYKKFNPLKQIYKLMIIFFLVVLVCQILFFNFDMKELLAPLVLGGAYVPKIKLMAGSYWFVPVYATCILFAKIIIDYLKENFIKLFLILVPLFYIYIYFSHNTYESPAVFGGVSIQMFLFYLWLIILGFKTYNLNKKLLWVVISLVVFIFIIFSFLQQDFSLQAYKFPVGLPYIIASMFSVSLTVILKCKLKRNWFEFLGKKAIYFYLSQAISSSILFSIVRIIHIHWFVKLSICFTINLAMALGIGVLLSIVEPKISSKFTK